MINDDVTPQRITGLITHCGFYYIVPVTLRLHRPDMHTNVSSDDKHLAVYFDGCQYCGDNDQRLTGRVGLGVVTGRRGRGGDGGRGQTNGIGGDQWSSGKPPVSSSSGLGFEQSL
ncbi:hypothetical protein BaRGS_00040135 [Batillaria attramentaria]|uniref:Uncharacterized protein n=1 Tax=Batillaria attramentaria TaxID=370345 RepID=A0ABD0J1V1_9CAEN